MLKQITFTTDTKEYKGLLIENNVDTFLKFGEIIEMNKIWMKKHIESNPKQIFPIMLHASNEETMLVKEGLYILSSTHFDKPDKIQIELFNNEFDLLMQIVP